MIASRSKKYSHKECAFDKKDPLLTQLYCVFAYRKASLHKVIYILKNKKSESFDSRIFVFVVFEKTIALSVVLCYNDLTLYKFPKEKLKNEKADSH